MLMSEFDALMESMERTAYNKWMRNEGIPVIHGYGIEDVRDLELASWERMGGKGAFINLYGMGGATGMYEAQIPPSGALKLEKHLYEEVICILDGRGTTEVWENGAKQVFEWGHALPGDIAIDRKDIAAPMNDRRNISTTPT